jgi:hypothetical protein
MAQEGHACVAQGGKESHVLLGRPARRLDRQTVQDCRDVPREGRAIYQVPEQ